MAMTDIGWNLYFAEHDNDVNSKPPAPAINSSWNILIPHHAVVMSDCCFPMYDFDNGDHLDTDAKVRPTVMLVV
jgi:hypothetical protein